MYHWNAYSKNGVVLSERQVTFSCIQINKLVPDITEKNTEDVLMFIIWKLSNGYATQDLKHAA